MHWPRPKSGFEHSEETREVKKDVNWTRPGVLDDIVNVPLVPPANLADPANPVGAGCFDTCGQVLECQKTTLTLAEPGSGDREVEHLWQDLEREQNIEAALRQRLAILEVEIQECTESERSLRSAEQFDAGLDGEAEALGGELHSLCEAVEMLRVDNSQLQEELSNSETREAELAMELWQMRIRMESARSAFRNPFQ